MDSVGKKIRACQAMADALAGLGDGSNWADAHLDLQAAGRFGPRSHETVESGPTGAPGIPRGVGGEC